MEHPNKKWMKDSAMGEVQFSSDASQLGIPPGYGPGLAGVLDPWARTIDEDWRSITRRGEHVFWETTVLSPDERWVKLVIFND